MHDRLHLLTVALADRYKVEREIGRGGMATVYLAQDLKHNRQVAVKVLRPELSAQVSLRRFLKEIEVTANLQHPHILPLFDSGQADGALFYVMPFVTGETLRDKINREGALAIAEVVEILRDVADALSHAHAKGVIHRDIKPGNVLLTGRHAIVADFGIAKAVTDSAGNDIRTTLGAAVGTPAYMAPEQASGDADIDNRADIYALGAMAYEMLTGQPPFVGATPMAVLFAHVASTPKPLISIRANIPVQLDSLVMKCLAKDPAIRCQTADEFLEQISFLATPARENGGHKHLKAVVASGESHRSQRQRPIIVAAILAMLAIGASLAIKGYIRINSLAAPINTVRKQEKPTLENKNPVVSPQIDKSDEVASGTDQRDRSSRLDSTRTTPGAIHPTATSNQITSSSVETERKQPTVVTPDPVDVAEIASLLTEYAHAIESQDTANLRAVFPSLSEDQKAGFFQFFAGAKTIRAALSLHGLVIYGDSARASAAGAYFWTDHRDKSRRQPVTFSLTFAKNIDSWTIRSVR